MHAIGPRASGSGLRKAPARLLQGIESADLHADEQALPGKDLWKVLPATGQTLRSNQPSWWWSGCSAWTFHVLSGQGGQPCPSNAVRCRFQEGAAMRLVGLLLLLAASLLAVPVPQELAEVPVERLVRNLKARCQAEPEDARRWFRAHDRVCPQDVHSDRELALSGRVSRGHGHASARGAVSLVGRAEKARSLPPRGCHDGLPQGPRARARPAGGLARAGLVPDGGRPAGAGPREPAPGLPPGLPARANVPDTAVWHHRDRGDGPLSQSAARPRKRRR